MMQFVGKDNGEGFADKAGSAAGPWADDLREWIAGLTASNTFPASGPGCPPTAVAQPVRQALLRVIQHSVIQEDWPMIVRAHLAASRGDWRVVVALDNEWGSRIGGRGSLAEASMRAGQRQLGRMRPMRDARVVRRYIEAVDAGKARGWHPVVYGILLAIHSIPLRQGLAHHAMQVASVLSRAIPAKPSPAQESEVLAFEAEVATLIPHSLDAALKAGGWLTLQPCPA